MAREDGLRGRRPLRGAYLCSSPRLLLRYRVRGSVITPVTAVAPATAGEAR